jgi:hypothetical protein
MIGQQSASHNRDYTRQAEAEVEMEMQIDKKERKMYFKEAYALVQAQLHQEILSEIELGDKAPKRMSEPKNQEARNNYFAEKSIETVRRMSDGKFGNLSREQVEELSKRKKVP